MKIEKYFQMHLFLSIILLLVLLIILQKMPPIWKEVEIGLIVIFLLILFITINFILRKSDFGPHLFLFFFASNAVNGFYLLSTNKTSIIFIYISLSIVSLYISAFTSDIYKRNARKFFSIKKDFEN